MRSKAAWCVLALCLLAPAHSAASSGASFPDSLSGGWRFEQTADVCRLYRTLPRYGVAEFVGRPGHGLEFRLVPLRDLFRPGPVAVHARAPAWHIDYPSRAARTPLEHVPGGGLLAKDPGATQLQMDLFAGRDLGVGRLAWYEGAEPVTVTVAAVRFRPAYRAFADCYQTVRPAAFADVEKTRVIFPVDGARLAGDDRAALELVARYVAADGSITRIAIDGHTDASGGERHNYRLSKRRAAAVAEYLREAGIPEALLVVRYHADRYPVADNKSADGRARNRRATVRLYQDEERSQLVSGR